MTTSRAVTDANGVEVRVGQRVRLTGVVENAALLGGTIRVRADRQPEGYEIIAMIPSRCLEVIDAEPDRG